MANNYCFLEHPLGDVRRRLQRQESLECNESILCPAGRNPLKIFFRIIGAWRLRNKTRRRIRETNYPVHESFAHIGGVSRAQKTMIDGPLTKSDVIKSLEALEEKN